MRSLLLITTLFVSTFGCTQNTNTKHFSEFNTDKKNLALEGYDPVAYFTQGEATAGKAAVSTTYQGVVFWFDNPQNKALFDENPQKYIPQYGGWCAYAMGKDGSKVSINPKSFLVDNGKLYLFYKTRFVDTKTKWKKNIDTLEKSATAYWEQISTK